MPHSAIQRKQSTLRRINLAAQRLAIERGYDGFTLDDLAAEVGVSRRTLFNHVSGKEEAVIGVRPDWDPEAVAAFRAGGPSGNLFDDLLHLIVDVLVVEDADRTETARFHQLLETNPTIAHKVHRELEKLCVGAVAWPSSAPARPTPSGPASSFS